MKKILFNCISLSSILLISCSSGPIPKLYTNFEKASFVIKDVSKKEWEPNEIGEGFSFISDMDINSREHFLRILYEGSEIYEARINDGSFMVCGSFIMNNKVYIAYSLFDDTSDISKSSVTLYCLIVDKNGESSRFALSGDYSCRGFCADGTFCCFLVNDRRTEKCFLIKTNNSGEIISIGQSQKRFSGLYCNGADLLTFSTELNEDRTFTEETVWKIENENYSKIKSVSYPGTPDRNYFVNDLIIISHELIGDTYHFYRSDSNGTSEICSFDAPDDLNYHYINLDYYDGDLIIGMLALRDYNKDWYRRLIFLHYDNFQNKITSYCQGNNISTTIFKNHKVFFGEYIETSSNGTRDGNFKEITIK